MKKTSTILLTCATLAFIGCSDSTKEITQTKEIKPQTTNITKPEVIKETLTKTTKKVYSIEEIYNNMCIECHSADGSGNTEKLTPTMVSQSQKEIEDSLIEIEKDKGHIIMEHNRGEILKMGMEYSAQDMAKYMYNRFNK